MAFRISSIRDFDAAISGKLSNISAILVMDFISAQVSGVYKNFQPTFSQVVNLHFYFLVIGIDDCADTRDDHSDQCKN